MNSSSPVLAVYEALWAILEESPDFNAIFKPGNVRKHISKEAAAKEAASPADYPAIVIFPSGQDKLPSRASSDTFQWEHSISIDILSGQENISVFLKAQWVIIRLILSSLDNLRALEWNEMPFIVCLDVDQGVSDLGQRLGTNQWRSVMRLKVLIGLDASMLTIGEIGE